MHVLIFLPKKNLRILSTYHCHVAPTSICILNIGYALCGKWNSCYRAGLGTGKEGNKPENFVHFVKSTPNTASNIYSSILNVVNGTTPISDGRGLFC